jgi:hypothetical protein
VLVGGVVQTVLLEMLLLAKRAHGVVLLVVGQKQTDREHIASHHARQAF